MNSLTEENKRSAFVIAVTSFQNASDRWKARSQLGLTDEQLKEALRYELGIAGGCSANNKRPAVAYQGAGLKVWASWGFPNSCIDAPILEGRATMKMARDIYQISNPEESQLSLF